MKKMIALLMMTAISLFVVVASHAADEKSIIAISKAIEIAVRKTPGKVIKAELEGDIYEIKLRSAEGKREVIYIDAVSGEVIEKKIITLQEATDAALKEVPGNVAKVEFERGKYEIRIKTAEGILKEVYVDAESGEIVRIKEKKKSLK